MGGAPNDGIYQPFNLSVFSYGRQHPVNYVDPTGQFWGAVVKLGKLILKGGDVGATFAGAAMDAQTVMDSSASPGERLLAAGSLVTEIVSPVSARDARAGYDVATNAASRVRGETSSVFRGTTEGFEGSPQTLRSGVTPTSSDPLVAATYCKNAVCTHGGNGEFQVIDPNIAEEIFPGVKPHDFEVGLGGVTPADVANAASTRRYSLSQVEAAFGQMGITVPRSVGPGGLEDVLSSLQAGGSTPLSPEQVQQFQRILSGMD